jgi:hypothetical protein
MLTSSHTFLVSTFLQYRQYIAENPAKAGPVDSPEKYPYCLHIWSSEKPQGLKPGNWGNFRRLKSCPDTKPPEPRRGDPENDV